MADILQLLTRDLIALTVPIGEPQWGIFQDGEPVVVADSVVTFRYRQGSRISSYPVEQGSFESYNKVATPYSAVVRYSAGGSDADRAALLNSVESAQTSLDLFDIVTPEKIYLSANVTDFDYHRGAASGVGLVQIDVALEEVRVTATTQFSNTKTPSGANPVNGGNVSTQDPTSTQTSQVPAVQ